MRRYNCASDTLGPGQLDRIVAKIKDCPADNKKSKTEFTKAFLISLVDGENEIGEVILDDIIDSSRWAIHYRLVFKLDGKFYETFYRRGATEYQYENPYEYDEDVIECDEVWKQEIIVTVYER